MPEYIIEIEEDQSDESEIFIGWIRRHSKQLIRCKDCKTNPYNKPASVDVVHGTPERCWDLASRKNAFCSEAERAEECMSS